MDLKKLLEPLPIDLIEFRVAQVIKGKEKVFATLLGYKSARTDAKILDEVVGQENWQLEFRPEKDCVVARLGVRVNYEVKRGNEVTAYSDWVWKEGNGTPGDFEKEKGAYSDAQKRAGFQWGIGRGLYDFPVIFVELMEGEYYESGGKYSAGKSLKPQDWKWSIEYTKTGAVKELKAEHKGNVRFNYKQK